MTGIQTFYGTKATVLLKEIEKCSYFCAPDLIAYLFVGVSLPGAKYGN